MAEMPARSHPRAHLGFVLRAILQPAGGAGLLGRHDPGPGLRRQRIMSPSRSGLRHRTAPIDQRAGRSSLPSPGLALAMAVRQELATPGSVPAQRQFELNMAENDYYSGDCGFGRLATAHRGWTPFLTAVDPCPYRALADGSWALSRTAGPAGGER